MLNISNFPDKKLMRNFFPKKVSFVVCAIISNNSLHIHALWPILTRTTIRDTFYFLNVPQCKFVRQLIYFSESIFRLSWFNVALGQQIYNWRRSNTFKNKKWGNKNHIWFFMGNITPHFNILTTCDKSQAREVNTY